MGNKSILRTIKALQNQRGRTFEPPKPLSKEEIFRKLDSFDIKVIEQYLRMKKLKNLDDNL